jgi:biotin carboxyl carrier protein
VRYYVALDPDPSAAPVSVDLVELPSGALEAHVEGRAVALDVVVLGTHVCLLVDGRVVDLTTEGAPPDLGIVASGHRAYVRVESERMRAAEQAKKGGAAMHEQVVRSPMPGRVVKVLVSKGDTVVAGQGLLVLEAMKMENEVRARAPGTVGEVHVTPGTAVEGNAKLVTFL